MRRQHIFRPSGGLALLAVIIVALASSATAQDRVSRVQSLDELAPRSVYVMADRAALSSLGRDEAAAVEALIQFFGLELEARTKLVLAFEESAADIVVRIGALSQRGGYELSALALPKQEGVNRLSYNARVTTLGLDAVRPFMRELASRLDRAYPPVLAMVTEIVTERVVEERKVVTIIEGALLSVLAPPGTVLNLPDGEEAVVDESGVWERELEQNTSYAYRAQLAGHVAQNRVVFIAPGGAVDELRFRPLDRWRLGFDIRYINYVVVPQLEWYPVPGRIFVGGGVESSALALVKSYNKDDDNEGLLIHYIDIQLGGGLWMREADDAWNYGFTLGLATRIDAGAGLFRFADYATASLRLGARVSWQLTPRLSAFVEGNGRLALILAPEGVDPTKILDPMPSGVPLLDGLFYLELPTLFIGGRYGL